MPGYLIHLASCQTKLLKNRSFVLGVEAPDLLKKYYKMTKDINEVQKKYETLKTEDMPDFERLSKRIKQQESKHSDSGLHFGVSSKPNIEACMEDLTEEEKQQPFWKGYLWHLSTDAIIYHQLDIESKFEKSLRPYQNDDNFDERHQEAVSTLHEDWDKTNLLVLVNYPEIKLPKEIDELKVVQLKTGEPEYVDWKVLASSINLLRKFDPLNKDIRVLLDSLISLTEI